MAELQTPFSITNEIDSLVPFHWTSRKKESWKLGEVNAYKIYKDEKDRKEGDLFFDNFFLGRNEPVIEKYAIIDTVVNNSYYLSDCLIAFTSLFLCDFRKSALTWQGLNITDSIGIIARKSFSIRSPDLIDKVTGLPYIRRDNLVFIENSLNAYPHGTKFSVCAHYQPESLILLRNLLRLSKIKKVSRVLSRLSKIESVYKYLPGNILDTFEVQEKEDGNGSSYLVCSFVK